jgi:peptidyl-dipeptidase Dcp
MKSIVLVLILVSVIICSCAKEQGEEPKPENPLLTKWETPYGVPPFGKIREEHYQPAFEAGMLAHQAEIEAIANNEAEATFANTVEALDRTGELLSQVSSVFYNLLSANTNDTMQEIAKDVAPKLSKHRDDIMLNEKLFTRVQTVYQQKDSLQLTSEQAMLAEKTYKDFVRSGAGLDAAKKEQLREINKKLSLLSLQFGENILKENNTFELVLEKEKDLAGLPEAVRATAKEAAIERKQEGKWVFTLHKPSLIPFLQYSEKRELREVMLKGYINRGDNNNDLDNKKILTQMVDLRVRRAKLLGYKTHADYVLDVNMAKQPVTVYEFMQKVWGPALAKAKQEAKELQTLIDEEGGDFDLQPWDWWFYAEKLRKAKYDLDENMLRPYFQMEKVRMGVFEVATKLFGITFEEIEIPKYHEEVTAYAVKEADGSLVGILYTDYFPRTSKRGGAWMNSIRKQIRKNGKRVVPVICNVGNFSKPTEDNPALLSYEEVNTLFHEFGHALHGLLSDCTYDRLSGTSVPRDFVELPSQIMENWAEEPEVLRSFAKHYETHQTIPDELIEKIKKAKYFNQGFATVEYLAAAFLDMDWHTLTEAPDKDSIGFENASLAKIGLIPEIVVRYRSPYFQHIFAGGYSSGYYSYLWAEVLDADAFELFKEKGLFDRETAAAFRKHILSAGGTEDPMVLYKRFRGTEPKIDAMLKRRGLSK